MTPRTPLHSGYERLIGAAAVDAALNRALLQEPRKTALTFGLAPDEADLAADIRAGDLRTFASMLLPRLYGQAAATPLRRVAVG